MEFQWEELSELLFKKRELMLNIIIDKKGSTPRGVSTVMLVLPDGEIKGTIGGGPVENDLINESITLIKDKKSIIAEKNFLGDAVVCGGKISVLQLYISEKDSFLISNLTEKFLSGETFFLSVELNNFSKKLTSELIEDNNFYCHKIESLPELNIFGAGHIAIPLAKMGKLCDFNVIIYDDREEFLSDDRFPDADTTILSDFSNILKYIRTTNNSFFVLVTREHAHDEVILTQILNKPFKYIGMIGSKKRVMTVKENLIKKGFTKESIEKINAPIGLQINSETPAEIAVSIIAEIIKNKNSKNLKL